MGQIGFFNSRPKIQQSSAAANTSNILTITGVAGKSHILTKVHITFTGGSPGGGSPVVTNMQYTVEGASPIMQMASTYTNEVTRVITFDVLEIVGDVNTDIVIATAAAGASVTSQIDAFYR